MSKLSEIVSGWTNVIFKDPEVEVEAKRRAEICAGCEYAKHMKHFKFNEVSKEMQEIQALKCAKCGCPLSAKTRSMGSSCPENLW